MSQQISLDEFVQVLKADREERYATMAVSSWSKMEKLLERHMPPGKIKIKAKRKRRIANVS